MEKTGMNCEEIREICCGCDEDTTLRAAPWLAPRVDLKELMGW
jgi:hypothetical protein